MQVSPPQQPLVPLGAGDYRRSIRRRGPWLALAPPALLGAVSLLALWGNDAAWRGAIGFVTGMAAAPLLVVVGVPMRPGSTAVWIGVVASAVMWLAIGVCAARRATRRPAADWSDYWREYRWLAAGVWAGLLLAGAGAAVLLLV